MYSLGTGFVSGICVRIPCIKEKIMMMMIIIIIKYTSNIHRQLDNEDGKFLLPSRGDLKAKTESGVIEARPNVMQQTH
jgi:hypothetical protein